MKKKKKVWKKSWMVVALLLERKRSFYIRIILHIIRFSFKIESRNVYIVLKLREKIYKRLGKIRKYFKEFFYGEKIMFFPS